MLEDISPTILLYELNSNNGKIRKQSIQGFTLVFKDKKKIENHLYHDIFKKNKKATRCVIVIRLIVNKEGTYGVCQNMIR